jgi:hypothetical protein
MAVMLRTQGIAARVVNGFLPGEYNQAAGAYTVRQSDAHSWVEVYFPQTGSWVTFDPTPSAGRVQPQSMGLGAQLGKYAEAVELMWYQYVIGYDKQEQRTLATALQNQIFGYQQLVGSFMSWLRNISWIKLLLFACGFFLICLGIVLLFWLKRMGWRGFRLRSEQESTARSAVLFYERLIEVLARRGIHRSPEQTPREFASSVGLKEAEAITDAYNRVRYGADRLSQFEQKQIEEILLRLEQQRS